MLLFNIANMANALHTTSFQNISCYCLTPIIRTFPLIGCPISKHLMLLFNFFYATTSINRIIFQNISCYCLTQKAWNLQKGKNKFQNISCYCLTNEKSLFLNRFFYKKERFYKLFQYFYQPPY